MRATLRTLFSRGALPVVVLLTTLVLLCGPATAANVIDQSQPSIDTGTALNIGGSSEQRIGQVVAAGVTGDLEAVYLPVSCEASSTLVVEIWDYLDGTLLASGSYAGTSLPPFPGNIPALRMLSLPSAPSFVAGDTFAIVLREQSEDGVKTCGVPEGPASNPYAAGAAYYSAVSPITGRPWLALGDGIDLPFETEVKLKHLRRVDQEQTMIDPDAGGLAIGGQSDQYVAQTIEVGSNGSLSNVRLPIACEAGAVLHLEIQGVAPSGEPNGIVLASETRPAVALPPYPLGPVSLRSFRLSTPVPVRRGDPVSIVLTSPTVEPGCAVFQGPEGDSYAGGTGYFDDNQGPGGTRIGWTPIAPLNPRADLPFQTIVD